MKNFSLILFMILMTSCEVVYLSNNTLPSKGEDINNGNNNDSDNNNGNDNDSDNNNGNNNNGNNNNGNNNNGNDNDNDNEDSSIVIDQSGLIWNPVQGQIRLYLGGGKVRMINVTIEKVKQDADTIYYEGILTYENSGLNGDLNKIEGQSTTLNMLNSMTYNNIKYNSHEVVTVPDPSTDETSRILKMSFVPRPVDGYKFGPDMTIKNVVVSISINIYSICWHKG